MKASAIAIGTFDGFHLGHSCLVNRLLKVSQKGKLDSVVIALSEPVRKVCGILSVPDEKLELLRALPLDKVILLPNSSKLTEQPAWHFFDEVLVNKLRIKHFVAGSDFAFGKGREGDLRWLKKICLKHKVRLDVVKPLAHKGAPVSSSRIREALLDGELSLVNEMLGRFYQINAMPIRERGVGTALGFPTVNLDVSDNKLLPLGVFLGNVAVNSKIYPCLINIGFRPTFFSGRRRACEFHISGFKGIWPSKLTRLYLIKKLRDEKVFESPARLSAQIRKDLQSSENYFVPEKKPQVSTK